MMGAAFRYYAEVTGEKVAAAQQRVVARGVLPNSRISPGYVRGEDGVLVVERPKARVVAHCLGLPDLGGSGHGRIAVGRPSAGCFEPSVVGLEPAAVS